MSVQRALNKGSFGSVSFLREALTSKKSLRAVASSTSVSCRGGAHFSSTFQSASLLTLRRRGTFLLVATDLRRAPPLPESVGATGLVDARRPAGAGIVEPRRALVDISCDARGERIER